MHRLFLILALTATASAQWQLQDGHTTASLRGIHAIGNGVAWASGSEGTVLRTTDQGKTWEHCAVPPGAEKFDFRGVQAFDAQTAIVMSSGKGDLSRLYKTSDGCKSWTLLLANDSAEGFWDSLRMWTPTDGFLAGDPVDGILYFAESTSWHQFSDRGEDPTWKVRAPGEAAFAASNSSLALGSFGTEPGTKREVWFATGGSQGSRIIHYIHFNGGEPERESITKFKADMFPAADSAGIFSLAFRAGEHGVAVGGDFKLPNIGAKTAAFSQDDETWLPARTMPHGYRSSVAFDPRRKTWIAVGPNGTDASTDDGRNWRALTPAANGTPDEDKNWNALSLPFVVGPKGRIAILRPEALRP